MQQQTSRYDRFGNATVMPEAIMPVQFWLASARRQTGEQKFMLAILENAIKDLDLGSSLQPRHRRLFQEAYDWIKSDDATWPCFFEPVCFAVGLDPDYMRAQLVKRYEQYYQPKQPRAPREFPTQATLPEVIVLGEVVRGNHRKDGYDVEIGGRKLRLRYTALRQERTLQLGMNCNVIVSYYYAYQHRLLPEKPFDLRPHASERQHYKIAK